MKLYKTCRISDSLIFIAFDLLSESNDSLGVFPKTVTSFNFTSSTVLYVKLKGRPISRPTLIIRSPTLTTYKRQIEGTAQMANRQTSAPLQTKNLVKPNNLYSRDTCAVFHSRMANSSKSWLRGIGFEFLITNKS